MKRKDDIILDENGTPIIDIESGVVRYVDIIMIQYEYKAFNKSSHLTYINDTINLLKSWLINELETLNKNVLEHTKILYMSKKSMRSVKLSNFTVLPAFVKPHVTIYVESGVYAYDLEESELNSIIGKTLHKHFDKKYININDVKDDIMSNLGTGVVGIKISNIDNSDKDVYKLQDSSNRLSINKIINNVLDVVYDVTIDIEKI